MSDSFHFVDEIDALIAARDVHMLGNFFMRDVYVTAMWWPSWEQVILRRDNGYATGYRASRHDPRNILATLATYLRYSSDVVFEVSDLQVLEKTNPDEYNEPALYHDVEAPTNFHEMSWSDFVYAEQRFSCNVRVVSNEESAAVVAGGGADAEDVAGGSGGLYRGSDTSELRNRPPRVLNAEEFAAAVADSIAYAAAETVADGVV